MFAPNRNVRVSALRDSAGVTMLMAILNGFRCDGGVLLAGWAKAPEDHFGLIEHETMTFRGLQAGRGTYHAIDIVRGAASTAYQVMVVIAGLYLEQRGAAGRLDAAHQPGAHQQMQIVVHRLGRQSAQPFARRRRDGLRRLVRQPLQRRQHRQSRRRHPQPGLLESLLQIDHVEHYFSTNLELIKLWNY